MEQTQFAWRDGHLLSATSWYNPLLELRGQHQAHGGAEEWQGQGGPWQRGVSFSGWTYFFIRRDLPFPITPDCIHTFRSLSFRGKRNTVEGQTPLGLPCCPLAVDSITLAFYPHFWLGEFFYHTCCWRHCRALWHFGGPYGEASLSSLCPFRSVF